MNYRLTRPLALAAIVGGVWGLLLLHDSTPREDAYLVGAVAVLWALAVLVMVGFTREWSLRGLGLLSIISGDALLYILAVAMHFGVIAGVTEAHTDLIRAMWLVGGVCFLAGLLHWVKANRAHRINGRDPIAEAHE